MSLPSGYRQLEYIQSTGTQYIDTGYASSSGFIADIKLSITSFSSGYQCIMGSHNLASPWGRNCIATNSNKIEVGLCGVSSLTYTLTENTPYLISFSSVIPSGFVKVDGTTIQSYGSLVSSSDGGSTLSQNNVLIGANQYTVSNNMTTFPAKWYYIKLYNSNNTLIRDFIPCRNPSGDVGLYDTINDTFYNNSGTGMFVEGPIVGSIRLPSGYRRLDYIESTGTQYIDTGFIPNQDTRINLTTSPTSVAEANDGVGFIPYGAGESYNNSAFECYTSASKYEFNFGSYNTFIGSPAVGQKLQISHNKNQITLTADNTQLTATLTANTFTAPRNMILFGINRATPLKGLLKLYSCQIYDNGTLIRDYVPCKNPSGEIGLYDLVNQQFYNNAGTGTFVIGNPLDGFKKGDILNFDYTGAFQSITLPAGTYKLQCWGAQGGYRSSSAYGGKGGYSVGTLTLLENTMLYLYVGGSPGGSTSSVGTSRATTGGFNGGGYRTGYPGGGGASDIRIGSDSLYARVIVAGGGGSCGATSKQGMYGGGESGGSSSENYSGASAYCGKGGTQTYSGYSASYTATTQVTAYTSSTTAYYGGFGFGGYGLYRSNGYGGAGGGGWYGGSGNYPDSSGDDDRGGGGGSGYIYTAATASNYPSGCLLNSNYYLSDAQTIAGNTSFPSTSGETETGHTGNGYISITIIDVKSLNIPVKVNGNWKDCGNGFVKVDGAWKVVDKAYANINGTWKEISA